MRTPRTLTARLVATLVVLVALVSVLVITASAVVMSSYLTGRLDQDVIGAVHRAANPRGGPDAPDSTDPDSGAGTDQTGLRFVAQKPGTVLMVVTTSGANLGGEITESAATRTLSTATRKALAKVPTDQQAHTVDLATGDYRVAAQTDSSGDRVIVGQPLSENRALLTRLLLWSALFAVLFVLVAAYVGRTLVRRQLRPLREVAATAHDVTRQQLASGVPDLTERVDEDHTDPDTEVGQVGHALNTLLDHMSDALAARHRSEQQVRQFVADASHELRTPLSTIRGYAELSRRTPDDSAALSSAMTKVETETDRMSRLVEDLLLLARLDAGRPIERGEVDLTKLLLESVADARVVDSSHQWRLELPEEPVTVVGDEQRLHQLFTNLLGNARHHTPPGTTVTVSVRPGEHVLVEVHDDGPGLPPGLQEHAFERFTRGDSSRTRSSGGAGLGLSLVAAIAQAHGGTAAVHSRPGDTTFRISLPSA